jgi:hypothetical protein
MESLSFRLAAVDTDGEPIVVRRATTCQEVLAAGALMYDAYVRVEARLRAETYPPICHATRALWDGADFVLGSRGEPLALAPGTRHFVAMRGEACVGHVRVFHGDGPIDGFALADEPEPLLRASKLVVHQAYRQRLFRFGLPGTPAEPAKGTVALALFAMVLHAAIYEFPSDAVLVTALPKLRSLYRRLGFVQVGEAFQHTSLHGDADGDMPGRYVCMRIDVPALVARLGAAKASHGGLLCLALKPRLAISRTDPHVVTSMPAQPTGPD